MPWVEGYVERAMQGRLNKTILKKLYLTKALLLILVLILLPKEEAFSAATVRAVAIKIDFRAKCSDEAPVCTDSGTKNIEKMDVHKDCWNYSFKKTCQYSLQYPLKDQCSNFLQCYIVADRECLLKDVLGFCVSQKREFSCKRQIDVTAQREKLRTGLRAKDGVPQLVCKGEVPCLDGNCVNKSYELDGEMMESVSKLYAVSQAKSKGVHGARLFEGQHLHCTKKATEYSNCCKIEGDGWGHNLGAKCSSSEKQLIEYRKRNRCVYVGRSGKGGISATPVKHHYCCWDNMLNKVLQVEARKQLVLNFGSGESPNCRGLTLEELMKLDFNAMDFSEFFLEITKQMKIPNIGDVDSRARCSMPQMREFNEGAGHSQNKRSGVNKAKEGVMGNDKEY